jgi:hypothetical protein
MLKDQYRRLNNVVMSIIYFPLLLITSWIEVRAAYRIQCNRQNGDGDDRIQQEWESLIAEVDFDINEQNWDEVVRETKPNVEVSTAVLEIRELKAQVNTLTEILQRFMADSKGKKTTID